MRMIDFIHAVCDAGIEEVQREYARPDQQRKRDGALAGFAEARAVTDVEQLTDLWQAAQERAYALMRDEPNGNINIYWRERYHALQLEWVMNCVSAVLRNEGKPPLAAHLPTGRAMMQADRILKQAA